MPPHLLFRSKWFRPRQNLKVCDYVIVLEPGLKGQTAPRGLWEPAIVTEVFPGNDGLVRKANLRLGRECFGFEPARIVIRLVLANYCLRHNFTSSF